MRVSAGVAEGGGIWNGPFLSGPPVELTLTDSVSASVAARPPLGRGVEPAPVARLPVQPGNSDLCFEWQGPIAEAVDHLSGHGVKVETGPVDRSGARGSGRSVYFRDPDGSLLEFISYG